MRHPLRVGQVFRCAKFTDLVHPVASGSDGRFTLPPAPDRSRLEFNHTKRTTCHWTEHGQDGWERKRETTVDLIPEDADSLGSAEFEVLETRMCGGGCGHGPHDIYPDGHQVVAREVGGQRLVRFMQSGCFVGMRPPEDIALVRGPADEIEPESARPRSIWDQAMEQAADEHLFEVLDDIQRRGHADRE